MDYNKDSNYSIDNTDTDNQIISLSSSLAMTTESLFENNRKLCELYIKPDVFYKQTIKLNVFTSALIIIMGIIGNAFTIVVFSQKRFRLKSPGVFLLCLSISDTLFLITHFFEDTIRTYLYIYSYDVDHLPDVCRSKTYEDKFINMTENDNYKLLELFNITQRFELGCRLIWYLKHIIIFTSAYIITILTVQRALTIYFPLYQNKFSSATNAWRTVFGLVLFSATICLFMPFLVELNSYKYYSIQINLCEVKRDQSKLYFTAQIVFSLLTMFIPMVIILIFNSLIIFKIHRANQKRKLISALQISRNSICSQNNNNFGFYSNLMNSNKKYKFNNEFQKITSLLILTSISFVIVNLPYFICWCLFFYFYRIKHFNQHLIKNPTLIYFSGTINLTEIFYVLNFAINFFLYCASGKMFRQQLSESLCSKKKAAYN